MEKLVIVYNKGDGYTWYSTEHIPVAYESAEALYVHLEEAIVKYLEGDEWVPPVPGIELDFTFVAEKAQAKFLEDFGMKVFKSEHGSYISYSMPEILTLDDWFNKYMVNRNG
jgi:hypothetical protein